ncbi:MAG: hypothetical protein Q8P02_03845 [Candidatus Micrarchaeota archaeon]|nr:hypothetical protein [Candidatus Micrarchaeota archaeon]
MKSHLLAGVLLALLFSSLTFALSADEAARFYLKSGESLKLENVSASGTAYTIVKINGAPSVVLAPKGSGFEALNTESQLDPVMDAYAEKIFKEKDFSTSKKTVAQNLVTIQDVLGDCRVGGEIFLQNIPRRTVRIGKANIGLWYLIERSKNTTYVKEYNAIVSMNNSFPTYASAYDTLVEKAEKFPELVDAGNRDPILAASGSLRDSATTLKEKFATVSAAYADLNASGDFSSILKFTFYESGTPHYCDANDTASNGLTFIQNEFSNKAIQSKAQLIQSVMAATKERQSGAAAGTATALRQEEVNELNVIITNLSTTFGPEAVKALEQAKIQLVAALKDVNASGKTESFDALEASLSAQVDALEAAQADFLAASAVIAEANANLTEAQKKYGESDDRVLDMKKDLDELSANLTSTASTLSTSDSETARAQIQAVQASAAEINERAATLSPRGNDLDLTIIIGIAALVLALIGTLWYFKKMKPNAPGKTDGLQQSKL